MDTLLRTAPSPAASRYRLVIYGLLVGLSFTLGVAFLGPATLLPLIIEDYGVSRAAAGFYISSMTLAIMAFSIPSSILGARFGIRWLVGIGWALTGAAVVIVFVPGFGALTASRLVQGLGAALVLTLMPSVVMRWAPPREVPTANAMTLAATTLGNSASLFFGPPLAHALGWALVLGLEGSLAIVGGIAWFLLAREGPAGKDSKSTALSLPELAGVFRSRNTWLLALGVVGPWALFSGLTSWLPTYYTEGRGLGLSAAAFTVTSFTLAGLPASLAGGFLTTRLGKRRPLLLTAGALAGVAGIASVLAPAGVLLYAAVAATGFLLLGYLPALFSIPLEMPGSSPERAAAIVSVIVTLGNASSFAAPVFIGFLRDASGSYVLGLCLVAAGSCSLFLSTWFLPETGPGRVRSRSAAVPIPADTVSGA